MALAESHVAAMSGRTTRCEVTCESSEQTGDDLHFFLTHDGSPDVIGMNYYLTSDRWLDNRVDRSADGESVTCRAPLSLHSWMWKRSVPPTGVSPAIATISRGSRPRYGLPIAIAEVHTAGPRERQDFAGCVMRGKRRSRRPRRHAS